MPTLNVFDAGGKLLPDAAIRVMLAMTMPDDQQSQRIFLASVEQEVVDCEDADNFKPSKALFSLMDLIVESAPAGPLAGEMLLQYVSLKAYVPDQQPSLNKIRWICRQNALEGWSLADGTKVPTSDRRFKDFWAKYKSASHLWAAWQIESEGGPEAMLAVCQDNEKLIRFLGIAARVFVFARVLEIDLGDDPYIIAPNHLPNVQVTPPPPTEWALRMLSEYRVGLD